MASKVALIDRQSSKVLLFLMTVVFVFFPAAGLVCMCFVFLVLAMKPGNNKLVFLWVVFNFIFLYMYTLTKGVGGDWAWYYEDYLAWSFTSLSSYFEHPEHSVKVYEPLFHVFSYAISIVTNSNPYIFLCSIFFAIYVFYIAAFYTIISRFGLHRFLIIVLLFYICYAGITFTISLHLVRQYVAASFVFSSLFLYLLGRRRLSIGIAVLAILLHNSALVVFSLCAIAFLVGKYPIKIRFSAMAFSGAFLALVLSYLANEISGFSNAYIDDGSVGWLVYLQDISLLVAALYMYAKSRGLMSNDLNAFSLYFLSVSVGYLFFIALLSEIPLYFLRFYFYIEFIRGCLMAVILAGSYLRYGVGVTFLIGWLVVFLSIFIFNFRLVNAPFDYGGGFLEHIFGSIVWWIDSNVYGVGF